MLTVSTGLNGVDSYNVSVAVVKVCGMVTSDPVTLFSKFEIYNYYVEILFGTLVKQRVEEGISNLWRGTYQDSKQWPV